jgi:hypothetical protein
MGYIGGLISRTGFQEFQLLDAQSGELFRFRILAVVLFILGFGLQRFYREDRFRIVSILAFLGAIELLWVYQTLDTSMAIDYVLHYEIVAVFTFLNFIISGFFVGSLTKVRFLSFLTGLVIFSFYSFTNEQSFSNSKLYLLLFLVLISIELVLSFTIQNFGNSITIKNDLKPNRILKKVYLFNFSLLLSFLALSPGSNDSKPELIILAGGIAFFIFRILSFFKFYKKKYQARFVFSIFALFMSYLLFLRQSNWGEYSTYLSFFLMIGVSQMRVNQLSKMDFLYSLITTSLLIFFSKLNSVISYSYYINMLIGFLFSIILLFYFYKLSSRKNSYFQWGLVGMFLLSIFLYSPPYGRTKDVSENTRVSFDPIPFQLSNINFNNKDFVFITSTLPFENEVRTLRKKSIKNKILVFGDDYNQDNNFIYLEQMFKERHPFFIVSKYGMESLPMVSELKVQKFYGFMVYYPEYSLNTPDWNSQISQNIFASIPEHEKLFTESPQGLSSMIQYVNKYYRGSQVPHFNTINKLVYDSYRDYAVYYFKKKEYKYTLDSMIYVFMFGDMDDELLEIAFMSLNQITPEFNHIPIMNRLKKIPAYKESSLKRIYPIYEANNDHNSAILVLDELYDLYRSLGKPNQAIELEYEKTRISLKIMDLELASRLITNGLKNQPDSVIWQRLKNELEVRREATKKSLYTEPPKEARIQ